MRKVGRAKCHPDILLFLVRSCTTGAEDCDYHHYHNGDHSNRYYDYKEHVAVQGRSRTSMGTVTACKSLRWQKGVICYIEKIPIKSKQCPKTSRIMQIKQNEKDGLSARISSEVLDYFFVICQFCFCTIKSVRCFTDPFPTKSL